jgi:hypothetical protein
MRHLFEPEAVEPYAYTGPRLSTDALGSAGLLTDTIAAEFGAGATGPFPRPRPGPPPPSFNRGHPYKKWNGAAGE